MRNAMTKKLTMLMGLEKIGCYVNGNHRTVLFADGTKIKQTGHWVDFDGEGTRKWEDDDQDHFTYDFPENFDIKITDYCDTVAGRPDGGICVYCHENSSPTGKHGNLRAMEAVFRSLHAGTECACLRGSTIVHTPVGSKEIKDLRIGDEIYNSTHGISKISNITKAKKRIHIVKFSRGLNVESSADHPYMSNGVETIASKLVTKVIDTIGVRTGDNVIPVIDMAKYIHQANTNLASSRGGKIIDDNEIRLTNSSARSVRYVKFDADMAYLYGWFVAEGSRSCMTLCSDEISDATQLGTIWVNHTGMKYYIKVNEGRHMLTLELKCRTFAKHLMFDALSVGHGAKNKTLSYLYSVNNKELIRAALLGLFKGDGCFRVRTHKRNGHVWTSNTISLKTTSKRLAYDVMYLLKKWFNITASLNHGVSRQGRPIDGRVLPSSEYYMVEIYDNRDQHKLFPEVFDLTTSHSTYKSREFKCIDCIDTDITEDLYDITLDGDIHTFPVNGYIVTHNCGGGNALAHPDFTWLLKVLKEQRVLANVTINQRHLQKYHDLIMKLIKEDLVHGIGVSLTDSSNKEDIEIINEMGNNVVIHVIAGIFSSKDVEFVKGHKILVLGYKDLRRGHALLEKQSDEIKKNIQWLIAYLPDLRKQCKCISFDCLGLEQIDPKTVLNISDKEFATLFQGSDTDVFDNDGNITCATMYIDVPNMKVARMSTAALDKRYDFTGKENISELLKITTQGW